MKRFGSAALCLILVCNLFVPARFASANGTEATAISLSLPLEASASLTVGNTVLLCTEITPAEAADTVLSWTSSNEACAAVDSNGLVTAVSPGQATITVAVAANESISDTIDLTVEAPAAAATLVDSIGVTAEGGAISVAEGGSVQMHAVVLPEDASDKSVIWSVTNGTGAAAIDADGLLTGTTEGTVTVTAAACDGSDKIGSLEMTVTVVSKQALPPAAVPVQSIAITGEDGAEAVATGDTLQLTAAVLPEDASEKSVIWSIDPSDAMDAGAAEISEDGLLSGISAGLVTVRATARDGSDVSGTLSLAVISPTRIATRSISAAVSVSVTSENGISAVAAGKTLQLLAAVMPEDADQTVVWSIESGSTLASVDETGFVTATAGTTTEGSVTVRATSTTESIYGEFILLIKPAYEYVLVLNTNPDPRQEQGTGTLIFGGGGTASQQARSAQTYYSFSDVQTSTSVSGYAKDDSKYIGSTEYVCIGVGAHCYIWMEKGLRTGYLERDLADTAAAEMMAVYEGKPYQALTTLAGGHIPTKDGTNKLSILLEALSSSSGYYAGEDGITAIHIKAPAADDYTFGDLASYSGLLAHEGQHALFQHFVCGDDAGLEQPLRWLNEGLSVAVMDWVWGGDGNGSNGWLSTINDNSRIAGGESLSYTNYRDDSGLDYGLPYLFVRYLTDQAAHRYDPLTYLARFYETPYSGDTTAYLNAVLERLDLTGNETFTEALQNFYIAAVVKSGSGVNGFYGDPTVEIRVSYPVFDGISGTAYTLPGTGALVLRTKNDLFIAPTEDVGSDIVFIPFNEDNTVSAWGGGGTEDNPYQIDQDSILSAIALNPSGYYRLQEDITVSETVISIDSFTGTLDGNGYTIRGLNNPLIYENTGTVCNLNVELDLDGSFAGYTGGVVCWNTGTVQNVNVTGSFVGSITGTNPFGYPAIGALVGCNNGSIHECKADVTMSFLTLPANHVHLGQIAGQNGSGRIYDCIAAGSIRATQNSSGAYKLYAGGLSGFMESRTFAASLKWSYSLTQLFVQATGSGNELRVGRLVGCEDSTGAYSGYAEGCYGIEGFSAVGYTGTLSTVLTDGQCLLDDADLRVQSNFAGWDFENVWSMPADGYPSLDGASGTITVTAHARQDYYVGESLDLTGATVTTGAETVSMKESMLYSLPDFDTAGTYTVLGVYDAAPFSFPVVVTLPADADVTSLAVENPAQSDYLAGQSFDTTGVQLTAVIDGKTVSLVSGFTVSKTTALAETDTEIIFTYGGKTAAQAIRVAKKAIVSIARAAAMNKTAYSAGETLTLSGLTLQLTYSDGEQISGVTAETFSRYGLMVVRLKNGGLSAFSASKTLTGADNGAELYICFGSTAPSTLDGSVYCYAGTLSVDNVAHMANQTITLHIGFHEYLFSDAVEGGSGDYTTTLISGSIPTGVTIATPGAGRDHFLVDGAPLTQYDVSLNYQIRDNVQAQQFYVTLRIIAAPPSDECDILEISLGGFPCTIEGDLISVVLPRGSSLTSLWLNARPSPGAKQSIINGTSLNCTTDQSLTVYSQSNLNNELLPGKYRTYTIHASVAAGTPLPAPTGIARTDSVVTWNAVTGANGYLVTLMRDFSAGGSVDSESVASRTVQETRFDMLPVIPNTGRYFVIVQAVDSTGAHSASSEVSTEGDSYYCNLTPVTRITVSGPAEVVVSRTASYTAAVLPADAGNPAVTWTVTGGTGTAQITQSGVLTGLTAGTVTVRATAKDGSGIAGTFAVTVLPQSTLRTVSVDVANIKGPSRVLWIDGVPYSGSNLTISGTQYTATVTGTTATNAIVYSYNSLTETDAHKVYPTGMTVWLLKYENGAYRVQRAPKFDNLLRYAGSSIRITGTKGIRMITSIATATKTALTGSGIDGYKLLEYGTAVAWKSVLGTSPLVLGKSYTNTAYAYKKGIADPIYKQANGLTQYTNVLVNFNDEKCVPDLVMRPYIKLQDAKGNVLTLYGGTIERSIGYIAYQNRNAFAPGSASYNYIWGIIHYVYGKAYDKEYKG